MGKSIEVMLQAVGSRKPWVHRSLRPWHVWVNADGCHTFVDIGWNGGNVRMNLMKAVMIWEKLWTRDLDEERGVDFVKVRMFDDGAYDPVIPTQLIVEALRLAKMDGGRGVHSTSGKNYRIPRKLRKRYRVRLCNFRTSSRRRRIRQAGMHDRWWKQGALE